MTAHTSATATLTGFDTDKQCMATRIFSEMFSAKCGLTRHGHFHVLELLRWEPGPQTCVANSGQTGDSVSRYQS
jgi:hypothetical protein